MAITENIYTGNGATVLFPFTFPYLEQEHVKVSLDGVDTTAYTFANATTVQMNSAPANGVVVRVYRVTESDPKVTTYFNGSPIKAADLNDSFDQVLYVSQESSATAEDALALAEDALTTADAAEAAAAAATATANTALSTANTALSTANTAISTANGAEATAIDAANDAAAAVSTANAASSAAATASANASSAVATSSSALSTANAANATANTASNNATTALNTANAAQSTATTATSTANTALSTANAAISTASDAEATAIAAEDKADTALAAISTVVLYAPVANVASIPGSPADGDRIEIGDSTGIEGFSPLAGLPGGFVGDSGLSVRLLYTTAGSTWNYVSYFPNDPDTRYTTDADVAAGLALKANLASPALTGTPTAPTAAVGTNTTQLATTAFVNAEIANDAPTKTGTGASGTWGISITGSAPTLTTGRTIGMTGDVTWTSASFNGSGNVTGTSTLANSGVTPASYGGNNSIPSLTVDAKGRITAASTVTPSGTWGISVTGSSGSVSGGTVSATTGAFSGDITMSGTGQLKVAAGTTAQRSGTPTAGMIRYNTTLGQYEGYNGSTWGQLGGGATGAGGDAVFLENGQTVTTNYTLTSGKNAVTAGPVTINTGVTVTVPSGSTWVIV